MPAQAGVDIGSTQSRRVVVETRWGGLHVLDAARQAPSIVALPATELTFRALAFPFHDRSRLEPLVRGELEHSLAFPLADAAWDFVARPARPEAPDNVFASACPAARMHATLAQSLRPGEHPVAVDAEPFAFQRLLAVAGRSDGLVVDFGAARTLFCRVRGGHLDYVRVLLRGGQQLTEQLATARGITAPEAEALKCEKGLELPLVRDFYQRLLDDALLPAEPASTPLYLAGGGSAAPGLVPWLSERLGRPVEPVPMPEGLSAERDAVACGMALWNGRGTEGLNLIPSVQVERPVLVTVATWLALILAVITIGILARFVQVRRHVTAYDLAIATVVRKADPTFVGPFALDRLRGAVQQRQAGGGAGSRDMVKLLQTVSEALQVAASPKGASPSPAAPASPVSPSPSPETGLSVPSRPVYSGSWRPPPGVPVPTTSAAPTPVTPAAPGAPAATTPQSPIQVFDLTVGEGELKIRGEARSFDDVAALQAALGDRLGSAEVSQQGSVANKIGFTIRVVLGTP